MTHRDYLIDLANALEAEGFTAIHIDDEGLEPLTMDVHGAEAMADETLVVDDQTAWRAHHPRNGVDVWIGILCCNDAWETVYDHSVNSRLSKVLTRLADKYQPEAML